MNGRSIQDIVPPVRNKPIRPSVQRPAEVPPVPPQSPHYTTVPMPSEPSKNSTFIWVAVGGVVVAGLVVGLMSTVFHTARVSLTLAEWKVDISNTYSAGTEVLAYTPLKVSAEVSRTVPATGTVDANDRASGTIVISNLHSAKTQRLITNTRFETPEGKVYRIHAPITVPGYTIRGGEKVPGTIEAVVYADQPGESYNTDSATFKLPGLKGSNQYDLITAATKGPLTGGYVGKRATVEKSVRDQAVAEIKAELDRELREKMAVATPAGSIVLEDAVAISYVEKPDISADQNAIIAVVGTALAPAFPEEGLALALAAGAGVQADAPLELRNPTELQYSAVSATGLEAGEPVTFTLSGVAHLRTAFNERAFATDIAGRTKDGANEARSGYRGIVGVPVIQVRPFWLSSLPKNPERITVDILGALDPVR